MHTSVGLTRTWNALGRSGRRMWLAAAVALVAASPALAQGGFGGGVTGDLAVVERFDADHNGRLDADERKAARAWLRSSGASGGFRRRFGRFGPSGGTVAPGRALAPADVASGGPAPLYDPTALRTIFLTFDAPDWADELDAFYGTDVDVPATMVVDGRTYRDVGVHFRGQSSYRMLPDGVKKSLNLSLDFAHPEQRLGGYRTLNLLNGNGDPTLVRTMLYAEIARHYIPVARTNYARVVINGESWGIYVNSQQFNADFTREHFGDRKGARWKVPGSPRGQGGMEYLGDAAGPYRRLYEIKTKDDPKAWADLIALFRVLNETPLERLEAALAPLLDIDGVLRFLALEVTLVNSDGYWARASDYSIYQDPKGRFHVVPHDFNEGLSEERGFGFGGRAGATLDPLVGLNDTAKPLRSRLLAVPALRDRYLAYVRDIATKWLDWKTVEPVVRQYQALIADDVRLDTRKLYSFEAFQSGLGTGSDSLKEFLDRRRAYLLAPRPLPATADQR